MDVVLSGEPVDKNIIDWVAVAESINLWIPPEEVNELLLKLEEDAVIIKGEGIPDAGAVAVADKPPK